MARNGFRMMDAEMHVMEPVDARDEGRVPPSANIYNGRAWHDAVYDPLFAPLPVKRQLVAPSIGS